MYKETGGAIVGQRHSVWLSKRTVVGSILTWEDGLFLFSQFSGKMRSVKFGHLWNIASNALGPFVYSNVSVKSR